MKIKATFFCFIVLSALPLLSYADTDVHVTNNTSQTATGRFNDSPCSSTLGDRGIVHPYQADFTIPRSIITAFCLPIFNCTVHIYANNNCQNPEKGTVTVNADKGVVSVDNHDKTHFTVTGSGRHLTVTENKNSFVNWMKSLF